MTRSQFIRMIALAAEIGADAAYDEMQSEEYELALDAERDCDDGLYVYGCGVYDTVDHKGRALRPTYNEAGEHYSM